MSVYLRLFGGARIDSDDAPARGRSAQRRRIALLALLAATPGNRLTRERVLAFLWPERTSDAGRKLLSEALHVIRRELGEDTIISIGDELLLDTDAVRSDVGDFRAALAEGRLEDAVRVYAGPFLDGWYVPGTRDLDDWIERERRSFAATCTTAIERLGDAAAVRGDAAAAAEWWRAGCAIDPQSTRFVVNLAESLAAVGNRAAALRVLSEHEHRMGDEDFPVDAAVPELAARLRTDTHGWQSPPRPIAVQPVNSSIEARTSPADVATPVSARSSFWPLALSFAVGITVLLAAAVPFIRGPAPEHGSTRAELASLDPRRVAVLYFDHPGRNDVGYVADGLTERLIDELANVPALHVVSTSGVRHYRDLAPAPSLDSIALALRAGTIVEGSVSRDGSKIRVDVGLVDARTNTRVGSKTIERPADRAMIFQLQDDIGAQVAVFLRRRLGDEIRMLASRTGTTSPAAQEANDRAQFARNTAAAMLQHGIATDVPAAVRLLQSADSLLSVAERADPAWPNPTIDRGWVARDRARLVGDRDARTSLGRAIALSNRVLDQHPDRADAFELRGVARWQLVVGWPSLVPDSDAIRASEDLARALTLDSTRVIAASALSQLRRVRGRSRDDLVASIRLARQAYAQDAFLANAEGAISQVYRATKALGELDSARVWCDRGHAIAPDDWHFIECRLALMRTDLAHADPDTAARIVSTLERIDPTDKAEAAGRAYSPVYRRLVLAAVQATAGRADRARAELARALHAVASSDDARIDVKHDETLVRFALGERRAALVTLSEYLASRRQFAGEVLNDPAFRQFGLDSSSLAAALARTASPR